MRTECYERDLAGNGYTVLASRRIGEYCDTRQSRSRCGLVIVTKSFGPDLH